MADTTTRPAKRQLNGKQAIIVVGLVVVGFVTLVTQHSGHTTSQAAAPTAAAEPAAEVFGPPIPLTVWYGKEECRKFYRTSSWQEVVERPKSSDGWAQKIIRAYYEGCQLADHQRDREEQRAEEEAAAQALQAARDEGARQRARGIGPREIPIR